MSTNSQRDRWLLPRRQSEFPARDLLPEETLHARREATFLALAALSLAAAAALVMLGTSRLVDGSALLAGIAPGLDLPVALRVPLGAVPFGASLVATALVCDLFGGRRARVLVGVSAVAAIALVGLMRVADVIDGGDAFGTSLAFLAAYVVAHASNVFVVARMRNRSVLVRTVVSAGLAIVLGWAAFAGVLDAGAGSVVAPLAPETILALAIGSAVCSFACVLVLAIPAALAARGLRLALRVGRTLIDEAPAERRLPQALIVDDDSDSGVPAAAGLRARRASLQPFSSAEMRFFSEGDALAD